MRGPLERLKRTVNFTFRVFRGDFHGARWGALLGTLETYWARLGASLGASRWLQGTCWGILVTW